MHLRQPTALGKPEFTYSAFRPFTKNKERIQRNRKKGDSKCIDQNELNEDCFQHDVAYGEFKDLHRRTAPDKVLHNKAFNIAKNPKYDGYQRSFASMGYKYFDTFSGGAVKSEVVKPRIS